VTTAPEMLPPLGSVMRPCTEAENCAKHAVAAKKRGQYTTTDVGASATCNIIDGLDITSFIRSELLNLTPNPDAIQETSIQTNTFSTDTFHGLVSDYFTSQQLWAGTEFTHQYRPFHTNNMSANMGGLHYSTSSILRLVWIEPLWQSTAGGLVDHR
jgi:hypothetical protein